MHVDEVAALLRGFPETAGQWGPSANISLSGGGAREGVPVEHGIAFRLRIPFPKARNLQVWMNGERLTPRTWVARAFTYVQVEIPPERSRREDFFVISCRYHPGEHRITGLSW